MPSGNGNFRGSFGLFCFILSNVAGLSLDVGKIIVINGS